MKFAKSISSGGHLKRMLHLLTSQVTFRKGANTHANNASNENVALMEKHFKLEHDNSEWQKYNRCTFSAMLDGDEQHNQPLLCKIEPNMSH